MTQSNDKKEPLQGKETLPGKSKKSIEEILRERKKLEKMLQSEYTRDVTLMFTDIEGSTSFFERRGDIEGRSMIQEHNDIVFPIIQNYNGSVVKTIGDAIMASFPSPGKGVRAAIEIQRTLHNRNKNKSKEDQIKVRIGLNYGKGIVQDDDVFGDVVNVAARVESLAEAEQILISKPIYGKVRRTEDILCRYFDSTELKGKAEPMEIYRVVWGDEEMVVDKTRSAEVPVPGRIRISKKIFDLEISREHDKVKVSGYERTEGEERTVVHYEDAQISPKEIEQYCKEVTNLLSLANKRGEIRKDILIKLRKVGQRLYNGLLTDKAKEQILSTQAEDLIVNIDDQLVQIPWELLYDGKQFFCQRFNMGRLVKTRQAVEGIKIRRVERPLKMLIISDPRKDLQSSYQEGLSLKAIVDKKEGLISANHKAGGIKIKDVRESLCHYDVVHYAGHADYDLKDPSQSGWLLSDGKFTSEEVKTAAGTKLMPALVFSNACHSGQTEEWKIDENFENKIYGLANSFLLSGVQHYIGTFWEVQDEPGSFFALEFYQEILRGNSVGEAVHQAREALVKKYGEETIVWASYMLYGDPTHRYFDSAVKPEFQKKQIRAIREKATVYPTAPSRISNKALVGTLIGALIIVLVVMEIYFHTSPNGVHSPKDPVAKAYFSLKEGKIGEAEKQFKMLSQLSGSGKVRGYEGLASVYFQKGDYQKAQELCDQVINSDDENVYAQVIRGNIFFNQGLLDKAIDAYEAAAQAEHGFPWQKAEAYNRLGRIYAEKNKTDSALSYYDQAIALNPKDFKALSNKGVLLASIGKEEQAISSYRQALKKNPHDTLTTSLLDQLLEEKKSAADKTRQERIDNLVADLVKRYKSYEKSKKPAYLTDTWTSRPLSITLLNFESKGSLANRAGEYELLTFKLTQFLQGKKRISVVERELIDKLLEELNLSSSDLSDPATALKLGKIIGARFIATGNIVRVEKETQVTLRVIETETSSVKCALSKITEQTANLSNIAEILSDEVAKKLVEEFPLQGKIVSVTGEKVTLNIGSREGVQVGLKMNIFQEGEPIIMEGREIGKEKKDVGEIEIVSVENEMSVGRITNKSSEFARGQKAIESSKTEI